MFFNGVSTTARTDQPLDPGLDGIVGGGDAQFRLTFVATGAGSASITFGVGYNGDATVGPGGALLPNTNAIVNVTVLPAIFVMPRGMLVALGVLLRAIAVGRSRRDPV